jgi:uncharacterized protein (DUF4415 family)
MSKTKAREFLLLKSGRKIELPTDEEEAAIQRGIALDPDNPELTDADFARMLPAAVMVPELVRDPPQGRGPQKAPTKEMVSLRLDRDVLAKLRATGPGWQKLVNATLRKVVS